MSNWTWRYNPQRLKHCPICGGKASHFGVALELPQIGYCWGETSTPLPGWRPTRNPRVFIRENGGTIPTNNQQISIPTKPQQEIASSNHRDFVYRSLLSKLRFSGIHKKQIRKRGFTDTEFADLPLATMTSGTRYKLVQEILEQNPGLSLEGVPGFYVAESKTTGGEYWTFSSSTGLLIPYLDVDQNLIGFQVRPDYTGKKKKEKSNLAKYKWVSSNKRKGGSSPGSPAGVLFPKGTNKHTKFEHIFATEGFFKALAIQAKWNSPVIYIGGTQQWKSILEPLSQLQTKQVFVAFDSDIHTNRQVQKSLLNTVTLLPNFIDDIEVKAVTWSPELGKGIDDAILHNSLTIEDLEVIDTDQILTSICPPGRLPNTKYLRINEDIEPLAPPKLNVPSREACWAATDIAMKRAFESQPGSINLITSGTGYGKTTSLTKHIIPKTLVVSREYDDSGEQIKQLLLQSGVNPQWVYGRQVKKCEPNASESKKERIRIANCEDSLRAFQAIKAGHNPCLDCPFFPRKTEDGSIHYGCGYRQHRDELNENWPDIGLAVPNVALQPNILKKFETVVFDDIANLITLIADQKTMTISDLAVWQTNKFLEMPKDFQDFMTVLRAELSTCHREPLQPSDNLRRIAKLALKSIKREQAPLPCEQPFVGARGKVEYPKAWAKEFLRCFADGLPIDLTAENVTFWSGKPEVLELFKSKRIIILDATADLTTYKALFGTSLFYLLNIPELPKSHPRIVQVPDIIFDKEQVQRMAPQILQLAERENSFVITRAGACVDVLGADGWLGRHDRSLNSLQNRDSGILAGHYSLPPDETRRMAQGIRALSRQLNVPDPEVPIVERDKDGRAWKSYHDLSKRYTGLQRYCAVHKDLLAEHISQHHRTSAIIQTWGRGRGQKQLFLLDGKPLYSADPENQLFVTIMTLEELALTPQRSRTTHPKLQKMNEVRAEKREERIKEGVEALRESVLINEKVPTLKRMRELLGRDNQKARVEVAQDVRRKLQAILERFLDENQHDRKVESTFSYTPLNNSDS